MSILGLDTFTRANNASSWGSASDTGGAWSHALGVNTTAISGNRGTIGTASGNNVMYLGSTTTADGEVLVRLSSTVGNTASVNYGAVLRATASNTYYSAQVNASNFLIQKNVSGTATTLAGSSSAFTITANTNYWIRMRVQGSAIQGKIWQDGTVEPTAWTSDVTDTSITGAGQFGVRSSVASSGATISFDHFSANDLTYDFSNGGDTNTILDADQLSGVDFVEVFNRTDSLTTTEATSNTQIAVSTDSLTLSETTNNTQIALTTDSLTISDSLSYGNATDTFTRADNASSWGTASNGIDTWSKTGTGTVSISSNEGVIVSAGSDTNMQLGTAQASDFDITCRISFNDTGDIGGIEGRYSVSGGNVSCYKFLFYTGAVHLNKAVSGTNTQLTTASFTITANTFYWMRLQIIGTTLNGKIWADGSAEPTAWTTTTTDSSVVGNGGYAVLGNTAGPSTGVRFDHFNGISLGYSSSTTNTWNAGDIALSVSDSIAETEVFIPTETLSATETPTFTLAYTISESAVITDSTNNTQITSTTDSLSTSDLVSEPLAYSATDTLTVIENGFIAIVNANTDIATVTETEQETLALSVVEIATESETSLNTQVYSSTDALSVSDALTSTSATASNLTDNALTPIETAIYNEVFLPVESLTQTDTSREALSFSSTDALNVSETNVETILGSNSDLLTSNEIGTFSLVLSVSDTLTTSDTISGAQAINVALSDVGLAVSESALYTETLITTDILSNTETPSLALSYTAIDVLVASENATSTTGFTPSDTTTVLEVDAFVEVWSSVDVLTVDELLGVSGVHQDSQMSGIDQLTTSDAITATDIFIPVDTLSAIFDQSTTTGIMAPTDQLTIVDTSAMYSQQPMASTDQLSVAESFLATEQRLLSDAITTLYDTSVNTQAYITTDSNSVNDSIVGYSFTGVFFTDQLTITENINATEIFAPVEETPAGEGFAARPFVLSITFSDTSLASDNIQAFVVAPLVDIPALPTDMLSSNVALAVADTVFLSDALQATMARTIIDSTGPTADIIEGFSYDNRLMDTLVPSDSLFALVLAPLSDSSLYIQDSIISSETVWTIIIQRVRSGIINMVVRTGDMRQQIRTGQEVMNVRTGEAVQRVRSGIAYEDVT